MPRVEAHRPQCHAIIASLAKDGVESFVHESAKTLKELRCVAEASTAPTRFTARIDDLVAKIIGGSVPDGSSEFLDELSSQIVKVRQQNVPPCLSLYLNTVSVASRLAIFTRLRKWSYACCRPESRTE